MTHYPFPDSRGTKIAFAAFFTAMLFLARDSMFTTAVIGFEKAQFLMLGVICLLGVAFMIVNRRYLTQILKDRRMIVVVVSAAVCLLPMLVKRDWQLMYFSVLLCLLTAVLLSYFLTLRDAARYYVVILSVLGAYSVLAAYILRIGVDSGAYAVPVFRNSMGFEFHNFFLSIVPDTYVKNRNFGIFREPGVYQFFLFLALYLCFYHVAWEKELHMWYCSGILCLALLSTFSTGAIAAMAVLLVTVYFEKKLYRSPLGKLLTAVAFILGAAFLAWLFIRKPPLYTTLLYMVQKVTPGNPSFDDRFESIYINLHLLSFRPRVGREVAYVLEIIPDNTSSTTILFAILGIFSGWLHVIAWLCLVLRGKGHWATKLLCLLALAITFNTQNLISDPYFWIFPILALIECVELLLDRLPKKNASIPEQA